MQYSLWLIKEITFLLLVASIISHRADGRRYDKCETPDGREGVCVVKRYCREATVQPLEACDNDDNFCCPIPTTHRSARPPAFPASEPHNTRNVDIQRNVPNMSQDSDHRSVTRDFPRGNQRPAYDHPNPGENPLSNIPSDSHIVPPASSEGNQRPVTSHLIPEESHNPRNYDIPQNVPKAPQDSDHRSRTRDFPSGNQKPVYNHDTPRGDFPSDMSQDSPKVPSPSSADSRGPVTSQLNPEKPRDTSHGIPKSIPKESQESGPRSETRDFQRGIQRPVYDHANNGRDSLSNMPGDSSQKLPSSSGGIQRPVISPHIPKDGFSNIPVDSHKESPSSNGDNRRPVTPYHNPEEDLLTNTKENRKRTINSGDSDKPSGIPVSRGRVRFEDADNRNNQNRRLKPQLPDSNPRPSVESSGTDSNKRQDWAGPNSSNNNRNSYPKPQSSTIEHYPSRHQLEVQKLPSNPRRLKPLHTDGSNDTIDEVVRHIFHPQSQPKVPACGVKPYDLFIAGGETSEAYEWPWMTAIFRRHQGSRPKTFLCGGSLINTKYVLTAAHCFVNNYVVLPASSFVIRLGSNFLDNGEEYTVSDLVIHHNHSGSDFFNDIALIKIASEVYITDKIAPICLPTPDMMSLDFVDRMATVAGWGDSAFRTGSSRALQHVTIPIVSGEECFAAYSRVRGAAFLARGSEHVICAGLREGGKDACLGDSGGPLMLKTVDDRWMIVGIVSLGYKCAEPGYPGVYTRVTHYLSWIHANLKPH